MHMSRRLGIKDNEKKKGERKESKEQKEHQQVNVHQREI